MQRLKLQQYTGTHVTVGLRKVGLPKRIYILCRFVTWSKMSQYIARNKSYFVLAMWHEFAWRDMINLSKEYQKAVIFSLSHYTYLFYAHFTKFLSFSVSLDCLGDFCLRMRLARSEGTAILWDIRVIFHIPTSDTLAVMGTISISLHLIDFSIVSPWSSCAAEDGTKSWCI